MLKSIRDCWAGALGPAVIALLAGCSALAPCDHRDLHSNHALACMLVGYRDQRQPQEPGCLIGTVVGESSDAPIVVFVYEQRGTSVHVLESAVLPRPGQYAFAVPAGAYRVAAFADANRDLHFDAAREHAALYQGGRAVAVMPGQRVDRLNLQFRPDHPDRIDFSVSVPTQSHAADTGAPDGSTCVAASTTI